ncbi:MAG: hypothetical protein ACYCRE_12690, partial [Acidobacteriaceae bacterium]
FIYYGQLQQMTIATQASARSAQIASDALETSQSQFDRSMVQIIHQTAATGEAAREAKEQARIADETLRKSQRPWVNAESFLPATVDLPPEKRFQVNGDVVIKNTGTSIATDGWAMMVAVPNSADFLTKNWDEACRINDRQMRASRQAAANHRGDTWPIGFVLAPNQETRMRMGSGDAEGLIDKQIRNAMRFVGASGRDAFGQSFRSGQFYLLGCARYKDQFGTPHTTRFCFIYLDDKMSPSGFYVCNGMQSAD